MEQTNCGINCLWYDAKMRIIHCFFLVIPVLEDNNQF